MKLTKEKRFFEKKIHKFLFNFIDFFFQVKKKLDRIPELNKFKI